jgi:cryptochrome
MDGGETEALRRMNQYLLDKIRLANFRKPKMIPTSLEPDTSALSPYIKFGSLSSRTFYWAIMDALKDVKNFTQPPESLLGQMLFREWFYLSAYKTPNFDKMIGNDNCK